MEIMELAAKLGQAIKADSRIAKMNEEVQKVLGK